MVKPIESVKSISAQITCSTKKNIKLVNIMMNITQITDIDILQSDFIVFEKNKDTYKIF